MSSFLRTIRLVLAQPTRFPNSPEMKNALASASENDWMAIKQIYPNKVYLVKVSKVALIVYETENGAFLDIGGSARVLVSIPPNR